MVVVVDPLPKTELQYVLSGEEQVTIRASIGWGTYLWSTGEKTDSIIVGKSGTYWVETFRHGCSVRDSFHVNFLPAMDTLVFKGKTPYTSDLHSTDLVRSPETPSSTPLLYPLVFGFRQRSSRR